MQKIPVKGAARMAEQRESVFQPRIQTSVFVSERDKENGTQRDYLQRKYAREGWYLIPEGALAFGSALQEVRHLLEIAIAECVTIRFGSCSET